jgi:hypothetical protein
MLQIKEQQTTLKLVCLSFATGLVLSFQNCAPAQVELNGGVQTSAQLSVAPGTSEEIEGIFKTVLGRLPTAAELAQYASLLSSGMSSSQLQSLLAGSSTTSSSISALLQQYFGTTSPAMVSTYQNFIVKNGYSMAQVESLIKSYAR